MKERNNVSQRPVSVPISSSTCTTESNMQTHNLFLTAYGMDHCGKVFAGFLHATERELGQRSVNLWINCFWAHRGWLYKQIHAASAEFRMRQLLIAWSELCRQNRMLYSHPVSGYIEPGANTPHLTILTLPVLESGQVMFISLIGSPPLILGPMCLGIVE